MFLIGAHVVALVLLLSSYLTQLLFRRRGGVVTLRLSRIAIVGVLSTGLAILMLDLFGGDLEVTRFTLKLATLAGLGVLVLTRPLERVLPKGFLGLMLSLTLLYAVVAIKF